MRKAVLVVMLSVVAVPYACGGDDGDNGEAANQGGSAGSRGGAASHAGAAGALDEGGAGSSQGGARSPEAGAGSSQGGATSRGGGGSLHGGTTSAGGALSSGGSSSHQGGRSEQGTGGATDGGSAGAPPIAGNAGEAGSGGAGPVEIPSLVLSEHTHFVDYGRLDIGFSQSVRAPSLVIELSPGSPSSLQVSGVTALDATTVKVSLTYYHLPIDYHLKITGELSNGTLFTTSATLSGLNNGARVAFITKEFGPGDIRTWAHAPANAASGREAADGVCQAEADAAGLKGTFAAFLSSKTGVAYDAGCRAFGLSGTLPNCGQAQPPIDHAPWLSIEGLPIVEGASGISANQWLTTIPFHADGTRADTGAQLYHSLCWGGSQAGATAGGSDCSGWTTSSSSIWGTDIGYPAEYLPEYDTAAGNCSEKVKLVCLQVKGDFFAPNSLHRVSGKRAFVSKRSLPGAMSFDSKTGVPAADALCQSDAAAAGLANPANFRAYLGTSSDDALCHVLGASGKVSARCGLASFPNTTWSRLDGYPLQSAARIADSNFYLNAPLLYAADGARLATTRVRPWSGTGVNGAKAENCADWTSSSGSGAAGVPSAINGAWLRFTLPDCSTSAQMYCFEN